MAQIDRLIDLAAAGTLPEPWPAYSYGCERCGARVHFVFEREEVFDERDERERGAAGVSADEDPAWESEF